MAYSRADTANSLQRAGRDRDPIRYEKMGFTESRNLG